jgi:hypothetical protein
MRLIRLTFSALLALAVAAAVPAFAQHDRDDSHRERGNDKDKDDARHGNGRAVGHERHDRDNHDERYRHEVRDNGHHEKDWNDHERHEAYERHEARERYEAHERHEERERAREREWDHERYVWYAQHHRRYIPEEHFRGHFGREHRFVIVRPVVVAGHPRFQYGGYWFVIGRPLPPGWRYSDEVYVDYINDGYYMCSPVHPGIHISVDIL